MIDARRSLTGLTFEIHLPVGSWRYRRALVDLYGLN